VVSKLGGGKTMDTFMDKLAQKLNAQEMIKANSAADAEELKQLRGRIKEYDSCLEQMQKTNSDLQTVNEELGRVVDDKIAPEIQKITEEASAKLERLAEESTLKLENAKVDTTQIQRVVNDAGIKIQEIADESLAKIREIQAENAKTDNEELTKTLTEKIDGANEFVHRECVKVYRNVQAVIMEENNKQTEAQTEALLKPLKGKISAVMGISVAALVVSAVGVVLQILSFL
jgi:light-regulated signal transduction histidine kinase (bacteriophytochrome)